MRRHFAKKCDTAQQTWLHKPFGKESAKLTETHSCLTVSGYPTKERVGLHEYDATDLKICQVFFRSFLLFSETNFLEESLRNERLALTDVIL